MTIDYYWIVVYPLTLELSWVASGYWRVQLKTYARHVGHNVKGSENCVDELTSLCNTKQAVVMVLESLCEFKLDCQN